ncbi:unnamed protein product [Brassica napus]|uniref:(rape) hypothetical protein n=1 Tax=Brassica napus TaxID=3708 RepID=A0A817AEL6_BRANA|nr:unnamed protein product [Brassica napus]
MPLGAGNGVSRRRWALTTTLLFSFTIVFLISCSLFLVIHSCHLDVWRKAIPTNGTTEKRTLRYASFGGPFLPTGPSLSDESRGFSHRR